MKRILFVAALAVLSASCATTNEKKQTVEYGWTKEDTERYWEAIAERSDRIRLTRRLAGDEETGEGVLESFGTRYMPNAYEVYQKARETAKEREQALVENFPRGIDSDPARGAIYAKACDATKKAVAEAYRRHDELCHFLLYLQAGVFTEPELAEIDEKPISVVLTGENRVFERYSAPLKVPSRDVFDWADKYAPEVSAVYRRWKTAFDESAKQWDDLKDEAIRIDAARAFGDLRPLSERLDELRCICDKLAKSLEESKLLHAVGDMTSTEILSKFESEHGKKLADKEKELFDVRKYVRAWHSGWTEKFPIPFLFGGVSSVRVEGRKVLIGKYKVTRGLWMAVMGKPPESSNSCGAVWDSTSDLPAFAKKDEIYEFFSKLRDLPAFANVNVSFQVPGVSAWQAACLAGSPYTCVMLDGTRSFNSQQDVSRFSRELGDYDAWHSPKLVGGRLPNAFGLYDMFGMGEESLVLWSREDSPTVFETSHLNEWSVKNIVERHTTYGGLQVTFRIRVD